MNSLETQSEALAAMAQSFTESAASTEMMASILSMLPQIDPLAEPMGCGVQLVFGESWPPVVSITAAGAASRES
jgi:hypothetical protein